MTSFIEKFSKSLRDLLREDREQVIFYHSERPVKAGELAELMANWKYVLEQVHLEEKETVALALPLSVEWFSASLAIIERGGIPLFLPPNLLPKEVLNYALSSKSKGIILESELFGKLEGLEQFDWIVCSSEKPLDGQKNTYRYQALIDKLDRAERSSFSALEELWEERKIALRGVSEGELEEPFVFNYTPHNVDKTLESFFYWWREKGQKPGHLAISLPPTLGVWHLVAASLTYRIPITFWNEKLTWEGLINISTHSDSVLLSTSSQLWKLYKEQRAAEELKGQLKIYSVGEIVPDKLSSLSPKRVLWREDWGGLLSWQDDKTEASWGVLAENIEYFVQKPKKILRPGEQCLGEIFIRGNRYSHQRIDLKGETRFALPESDGWVSTNLWGDVSAGRSMTVEGFIGELISYRGEQYSVWPIEYYLLLHPSIKAAAVKTLNGRDTSESKAFVELFPPTGQQRKITIKAVNDYLKEHLPHYLWPKYVEFCERLPRTIFGTTARWRLK